MDEQNTVDVFSLSSQEFESTNIDSFGSTDEESVDSPLYDQQHIIDEFINDVDDTSEFEDTGEEEVFDSVKFGDTEIKIKDVDEAKELIKVSAEHYKDAQAYNQNRQLIDILAKENVDLSQLSFALDLLKKDPKAINSLVKDLDLFDIIDDDASDDYTPTDYTKDLPDSRMSSVLSSIESTPTYERTVNIVGKEWDASSLTKFKENPEWMIQLNDHVASGIFDQVNTEIQKLKMLKRIPLGMSDYQVYDYVGNMLFNKQEAQSATPKREAVTPAKKKSMSTPRSSTNSAFNEAEDILNMSTEEFNAKYKKFLNR